MFVNSTEGKNTYILEERDCTEKLQKKYETVMCLGNGYLGMRSAFCEEIPEQTRLTLIAGLYDKQPREEEELIPLPDVTSLSIVAEGEKISPLHKNSSEYSRSLNVRSGLLTYQYRYSPKDMEGDLLVKHSRFVSMAQKNLAMFETDIVSEGDFELELVSSINARITVNGTQHTFEEERTVLDNDLLWYGGRAAIAGTQFRVGSKMRIYVNGAEQEGIQRYSTERRIVSSTVRIKLSKGDELRIIRYATYYTANDIDWTGRDEDIVERTDSVCQKNFEYLLLESEKEWDSLWRTCDISVESDDASENLKLRLAMYHMMIMCPWQDDRVSIAAKGLTGMGYAGHVFWDCEIFNLPFFSYTNPMAARNLCIYRYRTLDGARRKARKYGYVGAMYPWESASVSGDEQSPEFKNYSPDNTPRRVTCGDIEQHVVCDVAYGVYSYGQVTGDRGFMKKYGLEILFETAAFWLSRLEYNEQKDRYEIRQVTGPDEYKEYVDNDVFTNYAVAWNLRTALDEIDRLRTEDTEAFNAFDKRLGLANLADGIGKKLPRLYLPTANDDGLIPQNDTYLTLKRIDISKYKNSGINRLIYRDYSLREIGGLMVSKQADLIQLFSLMPDLFPSDIIRKNFDFYEDKCIHDSSLSLSAFATVAARLGETDIAHGLFKGALDTDFGEHSTLCNEGIHAANCGGIWQTAVFGFAGIGVFEETLRIEPHIPLAWRNIAVRLSWRGCELQITLDNKNVTVESLNGKEIYVFVSGKEIRVNDRTTVTY